MTLRFSDGRVVYQMRLAQAEGEPQVLGATGDGIPEAERARIDGLIATLDGWRNASGTMRG